VLEQEVGRRNRRRGQAARTHSGESPRPATLARRRPPPAAATGESRSRHGAASTDLPSVTRPRRPRAGSPTVQASAPEGEPEGGRSPARGVTRPQVRAGPRRG
jgi:hypothetical protein